MNKNWITPLALACCTGCAQREGAVIEAADVFSDSLFHEAPFSALPAQWDSVLRQVHVPGMVVGVVRDGRMYVLPVGFRDPGLAQPMTGTTPFYIASVTKVFTAQAVLQLAQDGKLDLDAPVKTYLPRFQLADTALTRTLTVRDLLAHRKGLNHWPITFGEAFTGQMTEDRYYRLLEQATASGEFDYSNLHYTLLGRVIASVSGMSWKEYLQANVFAPAGMYTTSCLAATLDGPDAAIPSEVTHGALQVAVNRKTDRTFHAAGGMVSTAPDLLKWLRAHIGNMDATGHRAVANNIAQDMRSKQIELPEEHPFIPDQSRTGWGLGWMLRQHRGKEYIVHTGQFDGWAAHVSYLPGDSVGVVVLLNSKDAGMWMSEVIAVQLYERLLGLEPLNYLGAIPPMFSGGPTDTIAAASATSTSLPGAAYVGNYVNDDWGDLEVRLENGDPMMRIGDLPLPLEWIALDGFIAGGDHDGSFLISDGKVEAIELGMPRPDKARFVRVR